MKYVCFGMKQVRTVCNRELRYEVLVFWYETGQDGMNFVLKVVKIVKNMYLARARGGKAAHQA
jgi:hypothetical protein